MRRFLLATAIASPLFIGNCAYADMPVIDFANLGQAVQQVQYAIQTVSQMEMQVQQQINTVRSLTNIPQNMIGQVVGLLQSSIQSPLQNLHLNLGNLLTGSGVGTCSGAAGILGQTQGWTATGGDFMGSMINGGASRMAGFMACTHTLMDAAEQRLNQMPQLLNEMQSCPDVSCATAVSGRIQWETATINTQQQQAALMGIAQQQQRWTVEDQIIQKQRADAEAMAGGAPALSASGQRGSSDGSGGITTAILDPGPFQGSQP